MARGLLGGAMAVVLLGSMVACDEEADPKHPLVVVDVSLSGLKSSSRLGEEGLERATGALNGLKPGDRLTVYVFGSELTNACDPIEADYAEQSNSEEQDTLRQSLVAALPDAFASYVSCVRSKENGGSAEKGSPIFGAMVEALVKARATGPVTSVDLVTDGCSYMEQVRVCDRGMASPGFAENVVKRMPGELKPNLEGMPFAVVGLGRGTGLSSREVSVLREVFNNYAASTGADVKFE